MAISINDKVSLLSRLVDGARRATEGRALDGGASANACPCQLVMTRLIVRGWVARVSCCNSQMRTTRKCREVYT
jgi:hypothetical protein